MKRAAKSVNRFRLWALCLVWVATATGEAAIPLSELGKADLRTLVVPLQEAHRAARQFLARNDLLPLEPTTIRPSNRRRYAPGMVLVKLRSEQCVVAVSVPEGAESQAIRILQARSEVEHAEPNFLQERCSFPDDPLFSLQWHHAVIGTIGAWTNSLGSEGIRIGIVDTAFQMDHPDLAANVDAGYDLASGLPITASAGIEHSTLCAGMASAVINNQIGGAGVSRSRVLPIQITGFLSEMVDAVYWASSNNVRVVNISWSGAYSDLLNSAGLYLKTHAHGLLVMSGVNGVGFLDYPQQPHIIAVSMTDAAENQRSRHGDHIDVAAPGFQVYSTTTNGSYSSAIGTSYSAPLVAGIIAVLMSINPLATPDELETILKTTAVDKGEPGWDMWFGWGRVNFGAASAAARATLPRVLAWQYTPGTSMRLEILSHPGPAHRLLRRTPGSSIWLPPQNVMSNWQGQTLTLIDPFPPPAGAFYKIELSW